MVISYEEFLKLENNKEEVIKDSDNQNDGDDAPDISYEEFLKLGNKSKTSDKPKEDISDPRVEEAKSYLSLYDTTPPVPQPATEEKPVPIDTVSTILGDMPVYENQEDNQAQALEIAGSYGYVPPPETVEAKITEDDFDIQGTDGKLTKLGQNWRSNARIIYEHEGSPEGELTDQELSDWFKSRHSALNNNVGNMAATALDISSMSDKVKQAWVDSITTYGMTDTTWAQVGRGIKEGTIKDPVFWTALIAGLGIGGVYKTLGNAALQKASRTLFTKGLLDSLAKKSATKAAQRRVVQEDLIIENLVKQGVGKEAAENAIKKGIVEGVSEEALKKSAKEVIKKKTWKEWRQGAFIDASYEAAYNTAEQNLMLNLDLDRNSINSEMDRIRKEVPDMSPDQIEFMKNSILRDEREKIDKDKNYKSPFQKKDFNWGDFAKQVTIGVGIGGTIGWGIGKLGDRKALKNIMENIPDKDPNVIPMTFSEDLKLYLAENPLVPKETTPNSNINLSTDVITEAQSINRTLEVDGNVNIDLSPMRLETNQKISDLKKQARDFKRTKEWKDKSKGQKREWTRKHKEELKEISTNFRNRDERLKKAFNNAGIEVEKTGKNTYTGKKVTEDIDLGEIDVLGNRSRKEKIVAKIKQYAYDDGGLGDTVKAARTRKDRALTLAERNIQTRFKKLKSAIKKDYGVGLRGISRDDYTLMTRALRGEQNAINTLSRAAPRVLKSIQEMRDNITYLQEQLIESGAIKKDSDLEAKIISSMKDGGDPEFYITRQYEVFDNPDYPKALRDTSDGQNVLKEVKQYLINQRAIDNKEFAEVLELKRKKLPLSDKQNKLYEDIVGEDGAIDLNIADILRVTDEDALFQVFSSTDTLSKAQATKILTRREDIPREIRALMGEYQDPFTNYANTAAKIFQTIETFKYEDEIANLIRKGKIKGAATRASQSQEITTDLKSQLPDAAGVERPIDVDRVKPLEGLYGTKEVADYIAQGNEIAANWVTPGIGKYLALQGYARSAATVYSTAGLSRNFLGAGWMAFAAGYINPINLLQMYRAARGLAKWSNEEQRDLIEKGLALGFVQSGTDLGSFKGALKDAGQKEFWDMTSPVYKGGVEFQRKAKSAHTSAVKFYQSMDDMWKMFAFFNEQGSLRRVLQDKGIDPDAPAMDLRGNPREFMSGDGNIITITNLDEAAAEAVNRKMQNYAGVPKFVKGMRITPFADFLAFKSEIIRTQKNILMDSFKDIREGRDLQRASGGERGKWQEMEGYKALMCMIAAQSAAAGTAYASLSYLGDKASEIADGIQAFEADWNKGALYMYLGESKNGIGKRFNLSYLMPWATTQGPIITAIRAFNNNEDTGVAIEKTFNDAIVNPIVQTLGLSMVTEGINSLINNQDEYGRPIWDSDGYSTWKNISNVAKSLFGPFTPGIGGSTSDIIESYEYEGKDFGIKGPKMTGKKIYQTDAWMNLLGMGPEEYNIGKSLSFKMKDIKRRMGKTDNIFKEVYQNSNPRTTEDLINAYREGMENKVRLSKELGYYIKSAKKAGMNFKSIYDSITKKGLFSSRLDKNMIIKLIKEDSFIPAPPNLVDIKKWGIDIQKETGQKLPFNAIKNELMQIYKEYITLGDKPVISFEEYSKR